MIEALENRLTTPDVKEAIITAFGTLAPYVSKNITPKDGISVYVVLTSRSPNLGTSLC